MEKKNIKVAKQLLKLAKDIMAMNSYEKKIDPERLIRVWESNDMTGLIRNIVTWCQLRDAIANNVPKIDAAKTALEAALNEFGEDEDHINSVISNLESHPMLTQNKDYTINLSKDPSLGKLYKIFPQNNSYMQAVQKGIMEELLVLNQALHLLTLVKDNTFTVQELVKLTGLSKPTIEKLVNGLAQQFLTEIESTGNLGVEMFSGERPSYKAVSEFVMQTEKEFEDTGVKDHKIRIGHALLRVELCAKNSRLIIQKLTNTNKYLNQVLAHASFTSMVFDKELGKNFENLQGVFVPSAMGGETKPKASVETDPKMKTAGVMDWLKGAFSKIQDAFLGLWKSINEFFQSRNENNTTQQCEEIIAAFKMGENE